MSAGTRDEPAAADAALGQLFADHFDALTGYSMRRANPTDAADVVAETMLVAWRRIAEVPPPPATRPWLFGVARRVLANQRRAAVRRVALSQRLALELEAMRSTRQPDPAVAFVQNDRVRRALDALSHGDKEMLQLSAWEGLSPTEIAIAFDIPAVTARTRLHRARDRLRTNLANTNQDERRTFTGHLLVTAHTPSSRFSKETNERP